MLSGLKDLREHWESVTFSFKLVLDVLCFRFFNVYAQCGRCNKKETLKLIIAQDHCLRFYNVYEERLPLLTEFGVCHTSILSYIACTMHSKLLFLNEFFFKLGDTMLFLEWQTGIFFTIWP